MEALLIHSDNVEPPPVQLSLTAECPKVGLSLMLAKDWSSRTGSSPDAGFYHLEAAVKGIFADLRPTGLLTYALNRSHASQSCNLCFSGNRLADCCMLCTSHMLAEQSNAFLPAL